MAAHTQATQDDLRAAKNFILLSAMRLSPTGKEQEAFAQIKRDAEALGADENEIILALLGAIQDGVKHGNWPQPR